MRAIERTEVVLTRDRDARGPWPAELRTLLDRYPKESWRSNPSPMAQFWLDRHDHFRYQCRALREVADEYRAERRTPDELAGWTAPRLQSFLAALHGHHEIEDFHYFPAFRAAENRLAPGFDRLGEDHESLHRGIVETVERINVLIGAVREDASPARDTVRVVAERYLESSERVFARLLRHLDREEELIIPIMLDRG